MAFSYETQKNLLKTQAEGRDADSDVGLRDDAVRIIRNTARLVAEKGRFWDNSCIPCLALIAQD